MRAKLVQSELVGDWFVDLWANGTMDVFTLAPGKPRVCKLFPNMSLRDDCGIPEYVRHAVYRMRDAHRATQRLSLSYRRGTFGSRGLWNVNALSKRFQAFYRVTC
jgi:hypothetical protein